MLKNTFHKTERLSSKKLIDEVFSEGKSFHSFPFKVLWKEVEFESEYPVQICVAVPKRKFKKAVDRNSIKRKVRESYRINKHELYESLKSSKLKLGIVLIYIGSEQLDHLQMNQKMKNFITKLNQELG